MDPQKRIANLEETITKLQAQVNSLSGDFYKNNFTSSQTFNKDSIFYARLKVPHYSSLPTVAEVGDIGELGGKLYICTTASSTAPTFTLVGSQV